MNISALKEKIQKLNRAQCGSFGEYLVSDYGKNILQKSMATVHRDGVDLIFDGNKIDIGSRRQLNKNYSGGLIKNKDVCVFFNKDCCMIKYPSRFEAKISWENVSSLYAEWQKNHKLNIPSDPDISFKTEYGELKRIISTFFIKHGYQAKIIYRTVSRKFGLNESPDNLLPKVQKENRVNVYVDFNDFRRIPENIRFIIAFPDKFESEIPRQKRVSLKSGKPNVVKIDLNKIIQTKARCYFENLGQLMNDFIERYIEG